MSGYDLRTDKGLQAACDAIGQPDQWGPVGQDWMRRLSETLAWVRSASEKDRASRQFQERLWEDNHVAATGQGDISVAQALDDPGFRDWLARRSMAPLPVDWAERTSYLTELYQEIRGQLGPFLKARVPRLKIFRVLAALYPDAMTVVASSSAMVSLASAMGAGPLEPVARHVWVRRRLDELLGPAHASPVGLAIRMAIPWMLYDRFVQKKDGAIDSDEDTSLVPLPAARRRRGLTAIRGLFQNLLLTLEFVREGVTRDELLDFLRSMAPDSKTSSLGVMINCYQNELGTIRLSGGLYTLTARGESVLESQNATELADWLLTRVMGVDKALVELRMRGPMRPADLVAAVRAINPNWNTDFVPQAILAWLRSMGVIRTRSDWTYELTEMGTEWAARVTWEPEALLAEVPAVAPPAAELDSKNVSLSPLSDIVARVQGAGHFPAALIARLHAGLWSHERRHFAILTGLSGSGKTLLAREYARALSNGGSESRLFTLPVQPGWYDSGALLGFVNPLRGDAYVRTPFLEFLLAAAASPTEPHVAVLDEMNLSHPEQYMAPLLSAMETGDAIQLHTEDAIFDGVPASVPYPGNLVLIGTVNMDETTHGLSDKVLDRAFVLEFWDIDLHAYPRWTTRQLDAAHVQRVRDVLAGLMEALAPARLHFGWRVVDEVLDFMAHAAGAGDALSFDAALDAVIYAKVLPKLRGEDGPRLREALVQCDQVLKAFNLHTCSDKLAELRRDVETTGSMRFWR